jgi:hypothetical protein
MEMLTLIGGLCYVGFINPTDVVAGVRRQECRVLKQKIERWISSKIATVSVIKVVIFATSDMYCMPTKYAQ